MISPIKPESPQQLVLREARRMVARMFLPRQAPSPAPPPIARWKAWLAATWVGAVTVYFLARMFNLI